MKGEVMRREFEKIEWIKERLKHVWWSQNNEYCDTGKHPRANASFLNGALRLFQEQQPKVHELENRINLLTEALDVKEQLNQKLRDREGELQKRVDAIKQLIQVYKDEEKELGLKEWEHSTIYGRVAIELEQALKGGCDEAN
ncbi:hypothetical protein AYL20_01370 [Acinetobacter venetianus]|uniref:hypothetical protein n=1 Tax=Acinetobacter venetianus TaxID=52133 RepID=UPI000775B7DA|nr:hypothetical protein [Acinetobacter venetianus]KXO82674.1 hypothetical protein AYL20_01370 [Acinetobacter venetianus]